MFTAVRVEPASDLCFVCGAVTEMLFSHFVKLSQGRADLYLALRQGSSEGSFSSERHSPSMARAAG